MKKEKMIEQNDEEIDSIVATKPGIDERLAAAIEKLVEIQEHQPTPQIPMAKAKHVTPWNPTGKHDWQRPRLRCRVFMNDRPLTEGRLNEEEIKLINQLKPGRYNNRKWTVVEHDNGGEANLYFYIPNKTSEERAEYQKLGGMRGLAALLELIVAEQKTIKIAE